MLSKKGCLNIENGKLKRLFPSIFFYNGLMLRIIEGRLLKKIENHKNLQNRLWKINEKIAIIKISISQGKK